MDSEHSDTTNGRGGESSRAERDTCRIREGGMAHLFVPFGLGARCVCGRAVIVEGEDGVLTMREEDSDAA